MGQKRFKRAGYVSVIRGLQRTHKILQESGLHHVVVRHDDWCALLNGRGECNCRPEVDYVATEGMN